MSMEDNKEKYLMKSSSENFEIPRYIHCIFGIRMISFNTQLRLCPNKSTS